MRFEPTPLRGAYIVELEPREDARGFFARAFCVEEYAGQGLETTFVQINNSLTRAAGTLRGMHYQLEPSAEVKVVRIVGGAVWDVIVDLRPDSPTYRRHFGVELSASNRRTLYVPRGFAHGFLTLEPDTEALYLVSAFYDPEHERGIRWDDPTFAIEWPREPLFVSDKDRAHADFDPATHLA